MTYFVDPYKKYYEKLSDGSNMVSAATSVASSLTESKAIFNGLETSTASSNWSELGLEQITRKIFPTLSGHIDTISSNVEKVIKAVAEKATGDLLSEVKKLKTEDETLEDLQKQLSNLVVIPSSNATEYNRYISKKNELETKISESKTKCETYKTNCDNIVKEIKQLDGSAEKIDFSKTPINTTGDGTASIVESVEGGKLIKINLNGIEFYVANTRINPLQYEQYVQQSGIYQNTGFYGGECQLLSQLYATDMMRGTYTARSSDAIKATSPATRMDDGLSSPNEDDVKKYIYDELMAGRLTTLQCTQVRTQSDGWRHIVTVIGFDASVKSYKDLNPDTILVLDCVDGKIQTLSGYERTDGKGHNRNLYNQGGKYFAHGATQDFLSKEVENSDWQAKHGKGRTTVTA